MSAKDRILSYYDALRNEEPLPPYFARDDDLVKVGISERLVGYDAVRDGLETQTAGTDDWTVESEDLRVTERGDVAWFSDEVHMAWTDLDTGTRRGFDSRWSATLERREEWVFVGMHVSAAHEL